MTPFEASQFANAILILNDQDSSELAPESIWKKMGDEM